MSKEVVLYRKSNPMEPIQTVNGTMQYRDWLAKEVARINRVPGRECRVIERMVGDRLRAWAVGNQHPECEGAK